MESIQKSTRRTSHSLTFGLVSLLRLRVPSAKELDTLQKFHQTRVPTVAVCNAIIVQLSRIMSVLLTDNVWSVSPRVMCGDDYAILSWR